MPLRLPATASFSAVSSVKGGRHLPSAFCPSGELIETNAVQARIFIPRRLPDRDSPLRLQEIRQDLFLSRLHCDSVPWPGYRATAGAASMAARASRKRARVRRARTSSTVRGHLIAGCPDDFAHPERAGEDGEGHQDEASSCRKRVETREDRFRRRAPTQTPTRGRIHGPAVDFEAPDVRVGDFGQRGNTSRRDRWCPGPCADRWSTFLRSP